MSLKDITLLEWLTLAAIVIGPVVAVLAGRWLQGRKEKRERKDIVFRTLMKTRKFGLRQDHIEALNMIDVEFTGLIGGDRKVRECWRRYLNHLNDKTYPPGGQEWGREKEARFNDLLVAMSKSLGYNLDRNQVEAGSYVPVFYGESEDEQLRIRKGVLKLLEGEESLKVTPVKTETPEKAIPSMEDYLFK